MRTKQIKVTRNLEGTVTDVKEYRKAAPQKTVDNSWLNSYWLERDRIIYKTTKDEQTKQDILTRYGKL